MHILLILNFAVLACLTCEIRTKKFTHRAQCDFMLRPANSVTESCQQSLTSDMLIHIMWFNKLETVLVGSLRLPIRKSSRAIMKGTSFEYERCFLGCLRCVKDEKGGVASL